MKRVRAVRLSDEMLDARLADYEKRFGMSSAEFFRRFESGELDHDQSIGEYATWASLVMFRSARRKVHA